MKDILLRTGLTDRAVRLYIDSGLLSPNEEVGYTGRRSLDFSEEDVKTLCAIATLRRADFTIADIKRMQTEPENIGIIIAEHRKKLADDIETKKKILQNLYGLDSDASLSEDGKMLYTDVALLIEKSASENQIPGEDSSMRAGDFKLMIKRRIPSMCAVMVLFVMLLLIVPIFFKAAFGEYTILQEGGFTMSYHYTGEAFAEYFAVFVSLIFLTAAFVMVAAHVLTGKKMLILLCGVFSLVFILIIAMLPEEIRLGIYRYEFMNFRFSPIGNLYGPNMEGFIRSLKYVGAAIAAVLSAVGFMLNEKE